MRVDALASAVTLLTVAAVLAWPGACPVALVRSPDLSSDRAEGAATGGGDTVPDAQPGTGGRGRDVPVAEVAAVIDLLALALRGGAGLVEAMEAVADRVGGPLGMHLRTVAAAGRWGVEDATAWANVPPAWQPAARALRMATAAGVPPAEALVGAADAVRRREHQRLEVATATLGVRIVLPLGLLFLPAFILTTVMPIMVALAQQVLVSQ